VSKFSVNFIVDAKHLGDVMTVLQPYRIEDLGFKLVAGKVTVPGVKQGDRPAWQLAVEVADTTPRPHAYFKEKLLANGFKIGTVYNALDTAVENKRLVKRMIGDKPHFSTKGASK
jgi:hypothetical protein